MTAPLLPLVVAVSPYHLSTREAPAMAALQLAEAVVTLLPAPAAGRTRADVERSVRKSPRYLRMMESWRWTVPLWHERVIASSLDETELSADLLPCYQRIGSEERYAALRPLTRHAGAAGPDEFLDLLAADIIKGGPDPGLNIPVNGAIDAFAVRHGIAVARAAPTSVAQRAEVKLGDRVFAVAVPVLLRASARMILRVRAELAEELGALRREITAACRACRGSQKLAEEAAARLTRAAQKYAAAFATLQGRLEGHDDDEGLRISTGFVSVTGLVLPADVAMRSGLAAARAMSMRGMGAASRNGNGHAAPAAPPEHLVVLVFRELSARPDVSVD